MPRIPRDHFVPKAYLRGFTVEYLAGKKGGLLFVHHPGLGWVHRLSINDYVACEPEFYDNHPIDKHWSQTIEQSWPTVRTELKNKEISPELLDALFWFVAAQFIRTPRFMNFVGRKLSLQEARIKERTFEGRRIKGMYLGMADTGEIMDEVTRFWPIARQTLEADYTWTIYHRSYSHFFLTSDDPCQLDLKTNRLVMPLALDLAIVGEVVPDGTAPSIHHSNASPDLIAKIKRSIVGGCDSRVYAYADTPELRCFMKKNHVDRDIMLCGRDFSNDGKPMTDDEIDNLMKDFERLRAKDRAKESVSK